MGLGLGLGLGFGLAAVPADELLDRLVSEGEVRVRHTHLRARCRLEVAARDLHLLVEDVAREAHDLHAVEQGARDGGGVVGSAEEEHLRVVNGAR